MLDQNIIEPSSSPFCAPVCLVKKKDNKSFRFTVDYRNLNAITLPCTYILPRIQDILDLTSGSCIYSTFDLQDAYHQIDIHKGDAYKTAFSTHLGLYQFLRIPMGLSGSGSTFQRVMETIRRQLQGAAFIYLDDIVLASTNPKQHLRDIEEILRTLEKEGLKLKLSKTKFGQRKIKYLGFIIDNEGIATDPDKIKAVKEYPKPKNQRDVRSFLGLVSFYRRFIKNFATVADPLYKLLSNDQKFEWTSDQQNAFEELKQRLIPHQYCWPQN